MKDLWAIQAHDLTYAQDVVIGPFDMPDDVLDYMHETIKSDPRYVDAKPIKLIRPNVRKY